MKAVMSGCVEFCYCGSQMSEGRRSQVVFLDERRLEIIIQPKLYAGELLDLVASHFNLKEKEYFGLAFYDETYHYNWLQLDRRVLDHDIRKKTNNETTLVFYFLVKFFIESIVYLRDTVTVELFYLQAKSLVFKGQLEADSNTAFQLAAHVLQATHGDHKDDQNAKSNLKKLPVLPIHILKEHPSLSYCEDKVIAHYKKLSGFTSGACLVNYMSIVEGLPTYGVHYFEVKDKSGIPWWLGLSFKGIAQYDFTDKKTPRKVFQWKQLENLYFRDRKFSIEVHDPRRVVHALSSFNLYEDAIEEPLEEFDELSDAITDPTTQVSVSRRTFGPGNVTVHAWFAASPHLTQCIWSMAISQHQFYLDRKQNKSLLVRNLSDIANDLSERSLSLPNINRLNNNNADSCTSVPCPGTAAAANPSSPGVVVIGGDSADGESEVARAARYEMLSALKARRDALEAKLVERTDELKLLCIKEAELTGELPPELPLNPGEPLPSFRKRIGTAFSLPENLINRIKSKEEEVLSKLELDYEIQNKIASAALKLANDVSAKKSVRKQRRITYQQAHAKLKDIEDRLMSMRDAIAQKKQTRNHTHKKQPRSSSDGEDHNDDTNSHSTEENDLIFTANRNQFPSQTSLVCLEDMNNKMNVAQQDLELTSSSSSRPHLTPSPANTFSSSASSLPSAGSGSGTGGSPHHPHNQAHSSSPSLPASPMKQRTSSGNSRHSSPNSNRLTVVGYIPNSVYMTKSAYRAQQYPTLSMRSSHSSSSSHGNQAEYDNVHFMGGGTVLNPAYRNKYDAIVPLNSRGLYSVPKQRTSHIFPNQQELLDGLPAVGGFGTSGSHVQGHARQGRHASAATVYNQNRYGSLDRTLYGAHHHHHVPNVVAMNVGHTTAKVESRSLDNLDYGPQGDYQLMSTSGSRDTFELVSSQDYLDCPISPANETAVKFGYDEAPLLPRPVHLGYTNYGNPDWYAPDDSMMEYGGQVQRLQTYVPKDEHVTPKGVAESISPRAKTKEWYETSLDSPLPARRSRHSSPKQMAEEGGSQYRAQMSDLESPSTSGTGNFIQMPYETLQNQVVVTHGTYQPYREITKPYELSDYYKYSTKVRKRSQSSSTISDDGGSSTCVTPVTVPNALDPSEASVGSAPPTSFINSPTSNKADPRLRSHSLSRRSPSPYVSQEAATAMAHASSSPQHQYKPSTANGAKESPLGIGSYGKNDKSLTMSPAPDSMSLADAFHDEMLAWYEDQDVVKKATLV